MVYVLALLLFSWAESAFCISTFPTGTPYDYCAEDSVIREHQTLDDQVPRIGSVHALWIVASASWTAIDCTVAHGDTNSDGSPWIPYPRTYAMPYWKDVMFDMGDDASLSTYYSDLSQGAHLLTGDVRGQTDSLVFIGGVAPQAGTNYGGRTFFNDIMTRADAVINFNDYNSNGAQGDREVDFIFFSVYGFCDSTGRCYPSSGVLGLADTFLTQDTLPDGRRLRVSTGVSFWSPCPDAYPWDNDNAYWIAHGLAAHEYGHAIREQVLHWCVGIGHTPGEHHAFGAFDIMCSGSFDDPAGGRGYTSPHNPWQRQAWSWIAPQVITSPIWNQPLRDLTTSGEYLKLPVYSPDASGTQYFLVFASTRQALWERFWPSDGIQIHHVFEGGQQCNRKKKLIDPELSTGLWNWDQYYVPTPWPTNEGDDTLWAASNTLTANTISGSDSFDFAWAYCSPNSFQELFPTGRYGSAGNYFREGQIFCDTTNPSSLANQDTLQNVPTMIHVEVNLVDTVNHICNVTAWNRHWSGTVPTSALWLDSVVVDNNLTFAENSVLTIQPGTKIKVAPNARITIAGRIVVEGTENDSIIFECSNPNQRWDQLRITSNDEQNVLEHVVIRHADFGLYVMGRVNVNHVTVEDCGVGAVFLNAQGSIVRNSTFQNNDRYGAWIYRCGVDFFDNVVQNNDLVGLRLWRVPLINLRNDTIDHNSYGDWEAANVGGVQFLNSAATMYCNTITDNALSGVILYPQSYANMTREKWNIIQDNATNQSYDFHGEITFAGGVADLFCGFNTISDGNNSRWLLYSWYPNLHRWGWDATNNYWGTTDTLNIQSRIYADEPDITPVLDHGYACDSPVEFCDHEFDPAEQLYLTAWDAERSGQFTAAKTDYDSLINSYPESKYAELAVDRVEFCLETMEWKWEDIRAYFLQLAADSSKDSTVVMLSLCNAAWCLAEMEDYSGAYAELDSLFDHSNSWYSKMTAALERLFVELEENYAELERVQPEGSGTGSPRVAGNLDEAAQTFDTKLERISQRVDSLLTAFHGQPSAPPTATAALPKKFALYQNYPNPFNSRTEIRFDLPAKTMVTLKLFDVLGREVTVLMSEIKPAGEHRMTFDASTMASGVYLCRMQAGSFMQTRKMVLMK
jgi:hypothetical protein